MENEQESSIYEYPPVTHEQRRISELHTQLGQSRQETAEALTRFQSYRDIVRATVIKNIKDGTICKAGANDALTEWGDEEYNPTYNVQVRIDLTVRVEASDEREARRLARDSIMLDTDSVDHEVQETTIVNVEEGDEY